MKIKHFVNFLSLNKLLLLLIVVAFLMPIAVIFSSITQLDTGLWQHLGETVLADYISNSLILCFGVASISLMIGVPSAWFVSVCSFRGRALLELLLLLPMSTPSYIIAYTYTGILDISSPFVSFISTIFSFSPVEFVEVRSLTGAIIVMALVFYPYVYLTSRIAFMEMSTSYFEVGYSFGLKPTAIFFKIAIPIARPYIVAGTTLVIMETISDFGTVQYFGIDVFTTGIYRSLVAFDDIYLSMQMSSILLILVFIIQILEIITRKKSMYHRQLNGFQPINPYRLKGAKFLAVFILCLLPSIFGFIVPIAQLAYWSIQSVFDVVKIDLAVLIYNSITLSSLASIVAVLIAVILAYSKRYFDLGISGFFIRLCTMGYSIPGIVLAIGVLTVFTGVDRNLNRLLENYDLEVGLLFSGSIFILLFCYLIRFLAVAFNTVDSGLTKIKNSVEEAGRSLGYNLKEVILKIHLPISKKTIITAFLLVFIESLKELPATLILRPFDFNTLAIRTYELANQERLAEAGLPAILIVLAGIIPVIIMNRFISRKDQILHKNFVT